MTHFEVFQLPPRYELDGADLDRRYRELSLKLHPDRAKSDAERRSALLQSTALNDAYKVLRDPVKRAFYLLKLHGVDLEREDAEAQKDMPLDFLEEVLELREELAEAGRKKDWAKVRKMANDVSARQKQALDEAVRQLASLAQDPKNDAARKSAAHQLGRVRYFTRFLEEAERLEEEGL